MIAGRLKYRLVLSKPNEEESGFGTASKVTYGDVRTVWGERVNYRGSRSVEVNEVFADYSAQYRVRDAHRDIREGWRLREAGSESLFEVRNIIHDKNHGMLTLECEKVNE